MDTALKQVIRLCMALLLLDRIKSLLASERLDPDEFSVDAGDLHRRYKQANGVSEKALIAAQAIARDLINPPKWALLACWVYTEEQRRVVSDGNETHVMPEVLDYVTLLLLENEDAHWARQADPLSRRAFEGQLEKACREACSILRKSKVRNVRRRWDSEQEAAEQSDTEVSDSEVIITGYRNTPRIERVYKEWCSLKRNPDAIPPEHVHVAELIARRP